MTYSNTRKRVSIISISERMQIPTVKPKASFGCRHVQVILMALGFLCCYAIRVTTSVTLEAMTDASSANPAFEEFNWDNTIKNNILSSFFWGYVCTQLIGSIIAQRWGAQKLYAGAQLICGAVTLSVPFLSHYCGWEAVCASRVIAGLSQGTVLPCLHTLLSKWVPPEERGRMSTFVYAGGWIGNVICLLSSGLLSGSALGWPSCFYIWGGLSIVSGALFLFIGKESPTEHSSIPKDEKEYIETSLGITETDEKLPVPWMAILTSAPMWALLVTQAAQNWGFWMLLTKIPSYMSSVLNKNIQQNGALSSLPYLTAWLLSFPISYVSDLLIKRSILSVQASRKICNSIGQWIPAAALIGLGYVDKEHPDIAIAVLVIAVACNIAIYCGHNVNHMDLSPNFAGALMGITNTVANICSILAPLVASIVVVDSSDVSQWRNIFFLSAIIYIVGNLIFVLFGTSQIQPWNDPQKKIQETSLNNVEAPAVENGYVKEKEEIKKDTENTNIEKNA
nr:PREDICTED: putative inorganic phosphate cotransporter isoform X1 [Megachile rotundata]